MDDQTPIDAETQTMHSFAKLAGTIAIIISTFTLLGWVFYFWLPENIIPYLITTKANTSICFILSGLALWIYSDKTSGYLYAVGQLSAGAVFLLSCLTLFEYFFHINLAIDQSFIKEPFISQALFPPPGRMSPIVAANFVLLGFSLFFLDNKAVRNVLHQVFMFIVIFISFLQLLGFAYKLGSVESVFGIANIYSQMNLMAVGQFLILGFGIIFVRPYQGIMAILLSHNSGGSLARRLIPPAILLPIVVGYLVGLGGANVGFNQAELGISLLVMATIILFAGIILMNASLMDKVDIDRKQAEQALRLNQLQLQAILDNTSAVIYIQDLEGKYILVNRQFEKLFHKSASEVVGNKPHRVLPEALAEKIVANNWKVLRTRTPLAIEEVIPNENGLQTYISNRFPLFNDIGIPYAIGSISTDITEINRVYEVLRESEERLSLALRSAEAGTWSWDIPSDSMVWDEHIHHLFGLRSKSFPGTYEAFLNLIHPEDHKKVVEQITRALEESSEYEAEFRIIRPDESMHYISAKGKIFRDEMDSPIRMAGVCWDITQRKFAEEELRNSKDIAENLAIKAEEASRAKSAFLAAMSHEIRTPLNGVIGMTGLLLDTKLSVEQRDYIEAVRVSGEALLSVINDILDFSKIESGRMELENRDFDTYSLVDDAIEMVSAQVHRKGIAIGAYIEPGVPDWLNGDPGRVRQVLSNLLSNAAKFTEKGEIGVQVKLLRKQDHNVAILFEVNDSGIGITTEIATRLFQPFTQGDISTSRKYGGTGLGLAISKRLVELMGGTIGVESAHERGSKFWFTVELNECIAPSKTTFALTPQLENTRILCVDDNSINRDIIKRQIESWKMRCDLAMNAAEALSKLKRAAAEKDPYQLALVDYIMPGMNGIELIQIMRQLPEIASTHVVMLSSLGATFTPAELQELSISMSLTKPIRQVKLHEAIINVLNSIYNPIEYPITAIETAKPIELKDYRLLLVEDNTINQQVALRILAKLGYRADTVANGVEVLAALEKANYDLILMDCQMPEMDGYTATKEIRKIEAVEQKIHVPIIAMTAHALKGDREKCLAIGMDDYISKPIDIKILTETLEKYLSGKEAVNTKTLTAIAISSTLNSEAANPMTELPLIDMDRLRQIFGDDNEAIKSFIQSFIIATTSLLQEVEQAIMAQDEKLTHNLLHRLKGSAGNSGIMQIHALGLSAEEQLSAGDWAEVANVFAQINVTFANLSPELIDKS
jgi:PAS domain S-box-containing protein